MTLGCHCFGARPRAKKNVPKFGGSACPVAAKALPLASSMHSRTGSPNVTAAPVIMPRRTRRRLRRSIDLFRALTSTSVRSSRRLRIGFFSFRLVGERVGIEFRVLGDPAHQVAPLHAGRAHLGL